MYNMYGMPTSFNYPYPTPPYNQYQQQSQPDGFQGITLVNGSEAARTSLVPLNSRVLLMDSQSDRFWVKTVDSAGIATLQEFEFKPVEKPADMPGNYVSFDQFEKLQAEFDALKEKYEHNIREQSKTATTVTAEPITEDW